MAGGLVGAGVFGASVALGVVLSSRVTNPLPLIILGAAGAYGGWLVGVVVFGAVRGGNGETTP